MTSTGRWAVGAVAVAVLVATGAWVLRPTDVDARLWSEVRPVIETRVAADLRGSGLGESMPALRASWFCRAEALELEEREGLVRAGVDTYCLEYGVRDGALVVECSGAHVPQVVRLHRKADGGYRVVAREEPPDGAGYAEWTDSHFSFFAESRLDDNYAGSWLDDAEASHDLETRARAHFGVPAATPAAQC